MQYLSKSEYEASIAATRDARMAWWREARFGMFVHYGLYSVRGRQEWAMAVENYDVAEYEKYAVQLQTYARALGQITGRSVTEKYIYSMARGKEIRI